MDISQATPAPGTGDMPAPKAAPTEAVAPVEEANTSPVTSDPAPVATPAELPETGDVAPAPEAPVAETAPEQVLQSTGNESFDQVAKLLAEKGVADYTSILAEAANGDISFASKAALVENLGVNVAEMVMNQLAQEASAISERGSVEAKRLKDLAATTFGFDTARGEEIWSDMADFVKSVESGLTDADRAAMNSMLKVGGIQGDMVIQDIAARYQKSQGFSRDANLMSGDGKTQSGFEPLTKAAYQMEMQATAEKFGYESREAEALRQRRSVSMQKGFN